MAVIKGFKHSEETRLKMSNTRKGIKFSDEHKAALSKSLKGKGKVRKNNHDKICPCGKEFKTSYKDAKFCSKRCSKASTGHGLIHAPEYAHFEKKCAICSKETNLVGDHDHLTGRPRGVLCRTCNLAIGNMYDNPSLLIAAAKYLENV